MKTLQADLPDKLYEQIKLLIDAGWFQDEKSVVTEALRRFLETHKPELMEKFIKEDVEWGLRGKDRLPLMKPSGNLKKFRKNQHSL